MTDTTINWELRGKGERLAKTGLWLLVPPSVLLIAFVFSFFIFPASMTTGMEEAGETAIETSTLNLLMPAMTVGMLFQYFGLGMVLWALFKSRCRAHWFYYWMQLLTVLMVFASPGGIVLAVIVSRYLHYNKAEFLKANETILSAPSATLTPPPFTPDQPRICALEEENARLKTIVAEQALDIQRLKNVKSVTMQHSPE